MSTYTFKKTLFKKTTKKIEILDSSNQVIGSIQRYYKNKIEFILDQIFDELFIHVKTFDKNGELMCNAQEVAFKHGLFSSKWDVQTRNYNEFQLLDKTKIKTNPRLIFTINNDDFKLEKDFGDKMTRIRDSQDKVVCKITYDKLIPPSTITINILSPVIDIYTITCIYYLFTLRE